MSSTRLPNEERAGRRRSWDIHQLGPGAGGHRAGEEGVDERHEVRERAVVVGEIMTAASAARGVFAPDLVEDLDVGAAEGVDGLLGVADEDEVGACRRTRRMMSHWTGSVSWNSSTRTIRQRAATVAAARSLSRRRSRAATREVFEIEDAAGALGSFVCLGGAVEGFEEQGPSVRRGRPNPRHPRRERGRRLSLLRRGRSSRRPDFGQTEVCATERGCPLLARRPCRPPTASRIAAAWRPISPRTTQASCAAMKAARLSSVGSPQGPSTSLSTETAPSNSSEEKPPGGSFAAALFKAVDALRAGAFQPSPPRGCPSYCVGRGVCRHSASRDEYLEGGDE